MEIVKRWRAYAIDKTVACRVVIHVQRQQANKKSTARCYYLKFVASPGRYGARLIIDRPGRPVPNHKAMIDATNTQNVCKYTPSSRRRRN
jgi:hypothetical protein